jgi:hypothetical protein
MLPLLLLAVTAQAFDFGGPRDILQASEIHSAADAVSELSDEARAMERELESIQNDRRRGFDDDARTESRLADLTRRGERLADRAADARRTVEDLRGDSGSDVVEVAMRRLREKADDFERATSSLMQACRDERQADGLYKSASRADDEAEDLLKAL